MASDRKQGFAYQMRLLQITGVDPTANHSHASDQFTNVNAIGIIASQRLVSIFPATAG
jgi:hypothetical protein